MAAPQPRVTIKSVAARAGVSHPTVSRALRHDPRISEATRLRVQAAARELGYRPDPAMSVLIAHRNRNLPPPSRDYRKIAVLSAWEALGERIPYYLERQLEGIRARAGELGYEVEIFPLPLDPSAQRQLSRVLTARGIRGLIIGGLPASYPPLALAWRNFSVVAMGFSVRPHSLHYVANDHVFSIALAYQKLREAGYQRIGFFDRLSSQARNQHLYLSSYLKCLVLDGISYDASPPLLFEELSTVDPLPWLRQHRFDAVIAGYHDVLRERIAAAGVRVPGDVAIVAQSLRATDHGVAGVMEDSISLGNWGVDLLHKMLITGERGIPEQEYCVQIKGSWIDGPTMRSR